MAAQRYRLVMLLALVASWAAAADPPPRPADAEIQKLQERIRELERQLDPVLAPNQVSRLSLSGRIDNDTVRLKANLVLVTGRPRVQVPIAFGNAWVAAATLSKGCMLLPAPPGEDGYLVQVEEKGDNHQVTLDLEVPVTTRGIKGSERGFDLDLPRAAITLLDHLNLPPAVREVRIAGKGPVSSKELAAQAGRPPLTIPADRLEVTWRGPAPALPEPLLAAQALVEVRVDDAYVTTEAQLTLQLLRGQTSQWQVQLPPPPQATLEVDEPASDRFTVLPPKDSRYPIWTIQLKEPSAEPVQVRIRHLQPRGKGAVPIGPFAVPGAVRQQGTILVSAGPTVRLRSPTRTRGAISPREPSEEQRRLSNLVAVYGYWSLPVPSDPKQPVPAPLELEIEAVKGAVETAVSHNIRLALGGWQVASEIEVRPVRTEVEQIEVELPAGYELKATPPILVEPDLVVREQGGKRIGTIKLARPQAQKFKVTLDGVCETGEPRLMTMELARPVGTLDGGGRVSVSVPEGLELLIARDSGTQTLPPDRRELIWRTERAPQRLELAWRQQRRELPVEILADLVIGERQVRVRQHLRFRFEHDAVKQVLLQAPDAVGQLSPHSMVQLVRQDMSTNSWLASLTGPEMVVDYAFPLPAEEPDQRERLLAVPLLWPTAATTVRSKVRVWSEPSLQPLPGPGSGPGWQEMPLERVADRDTLPVLVLAGTGAEKLNLVLTRPVGAPLPQVAVDRALIQATWADGGHQTYRARFLIRKVASRHLDIELPAPPAALNLEVFLDDKKLTGLTVVDGEGREVELGHIVRLAVDPDLYRQPVVLEVRYELPRREAAGGWQARFTPPRLLGNVFAGRIRWQLDLPGEWVVVGTGRDAWAEQKWGLRGLLIGPRPAVSAVDVERWFAGAAATPRDEMLRQWDLVAWQGELGPLAVFHAAQQAWLLACSLTLLAIGLALSFAPLPRQVFWSILALIGLGLVVASIFWPNTLAAIAYGAEPGAAVLLVVVFLQWFFQRRYRQQVVFMPGFARLGPGSSLLKQGSSHRSRGEPSTVDAPAGSIPDIGSRYGVPTRTP